MIFSKWTDDDLLQVLIHTNGDFTVALETIIRHEVTGRPPEDLIRLLSAGGQHVVEYPSRQSHGRPRSESESETENIQIQSQSIPNDSDRVGLGGGDSKSVASDMISSEGAVAPSLVSSISAPAPPTSCTKLLEGRSFASDFESELQRQPIIRHAPTNTHYMFCGGLQTGTIPAFSPSPYSSADAVSHPTSQRTQGTDMNQSLSESRQRPIGEEAEESESKRQQMLNMQSGIEASLKLKKTRNTSEIGVDIDDEALAYAVKASRETFDEEHRKQEVRNALEQRIVNISLAASLADPVKKSAEDFVGEALKRSMTDPVPKSEEQLVEEAREKSLEDMERLETIIKSEEELVEEAKQKSLHTMSKDEELIEAVKRESLISTVFSSAGKKSTHAYWRSGSDLRQSNSTSTTYPLPRGFSEHDFSECRSNSVEVEYPTPSIKDSSLENTFDMELMDRKMPAISLPVAQELNNDVNSSLSPSLSSTRPTPNVASTDVFSSSSSDQTKEYDNRTGANADAAQQHLKDSEGGCDVPRC